MKKLSVCLLALLMLLSACGGDKTPGKPAPPPAEPYAAPEVPDEWGEDARRLLSLPWTVVSPDGIGDLTFDGERVTWEISSKDGVKTAQGVPSFSDGVMTVDGTDFTWKILADFALLTADGETWRLARTDSVDEARRAIRLVSGTWSGDGMALSFEKGTASFSVGDRSIAGSYTLAGDGTLTISNDGEENAGINLAKGAKVKTTSQETVDFPPELAFDGNLETRFSSAYEDPVYVTIDLGKTCRIGGAILYFEVACSSEFKIEYLDANDKWVEAAHVKGNTQSGVGAPVTVPFRKTAEARQFRFVGLKRGTDWGHSFYELELYEILPGEVVLTVTPDGEAMNVEYDGKTYRLTREP